MKRFAMTLIAGAALALSGCGGGGSDSTDTGGGGGGGGTPPPTLISQANAKEVATIAVGALSFVFEGVTGFQGLIDTFTPPTPPQVQAVTGVQTLSGGSGMVNLALAKLRDYQLTATAGGTDSATGVVAGTVECANGGFIRYDVFDEPPEEAPNAGDNLSIVFTNCSESGITQNGRIGFQINSISGTSASVTLTFDGFSVNDPVSGTSFAAGSITITVDEPTPGEVTSTIAVSSLQTSNNGVTATLTDFSATLQVSEASGTYSYVLAGTISDGVVTITVATEVPFTGSFAGDGYPTAGKLVVTATDGSSLIIEVIGPNQVKVTTNGQSQVYTWAELGNI